MDLIRMVDLEFMMSYPAMTVYEFEHFKDEDEVLECWKGSSIYIICQRPVLYFDEVRFDEETQTISLKIRQRGDDREVAVEFNPYSYDEDLKGRGGIWVEFHFYSEKQTEQPFRNVAGIKLFNAEKEFIGWLSPERLIYLYWRGQLEASIEGDIHEFLKYTVHYIGQAQNQNIWERLTGHEKLSRVLALEHPFVEGEFSPYELSLIFLRFVGITERRLIDPSGSDNFENINGKKLSDEEVYDAFRPKQLDEVRTFATNELEAFLVNLFEPKYNKILFKGYPNIRNGMKSIGFDKTNFELVLFATLLTDEATYNVTITPIFEKQPPEQT